MMWLFNLAIGSFWGRAVSVALMAWAALTANNYYQRSIGEQRGIAKVVEKSNEVAKARNAKARKIRRSNPVNGAAARLRKLYGPGSD